MNVKSIIKSLQFRYARRNSDRYVAYLRKKGVRMGVLSLDLPILLR